MCIGSNPVLPPADVTITVRPASVPSTSDSAPTPEAEAATPAIAATAPATVEGRGLGGHVVDVFLGIGLNFYDKGRFLTTTVIHPWQTAKGLVQTRPGNLARSIAEPYSRAIKEGRPGIAIGRGLAEIGRFFIIPTPGSTGK
ncbi:MAG: hypothetical protein HY692_09740 [Cyanobacteria bacterium NC_groundwater_1444_Ag_S-0.65um_54_12]|nr:hypothetical protein [Cyanobacteria bacterium NC_groundwater_1444_Ag_S-0.65um_54_12]